MDRYESLEVPWQRRIARPLTAVVLGFAVGAICVAGAQAKDRPPPPLSDFLGDTSSLTPQPGKGEMLVYRQAPGVLAGYRQILIPTPLLYFDSSSLGRGVDPDELQMLAEYLRTEVVEALEDEPSRYEIVGEAGPGVLVVRSAITGVQPIDPKKNVGTSAAGMALGVGLLVPRVDLGGASIEVEMLDGETGERLVAIAASKSGRRMFGKIKGAKEWGDVKAAFRSWAKLFRKTLDRVNESAQ